ncbi:hypothetical protein, partial [Bacillus sp. ISL-46]|uniref:hypothetical protein n=1 Tax=Bacillus sp. ISL-46 TaxID=2819129 RepID=UPI001BE99309
MEKNLTDKRHEKRRFGTESSQTVDKSEKLGFAGSLFYVFVNLFVDLRSRRFAFRGRSGEPPRRLSACGVSPAS